MQEEMLNKIHEGHQGMTKCIARAPQPICWPDLTKQIKKKGENCVRCAKQAQCNRATADKPITCQALTACFLDLFQWNRENGPCGIWLLLTLHQSSQPHQPPQSMSGQVEVHLCMPWSPRNCCHWQWSPIFCGFKFIDFTRDYDFTLVTNIPFVS